MNVTPLNSQAIDASKLPLESLASNKQVSQEEKIAQVSQAFEAVLLRQILSETQRPVFPSKFIGNSTADGIYRDQMVNQLAESISKSGGLGLARKLAQELQRSVAAQPDPPTL